MTLDALERVGYVGMTCSAYRPTELHSKVYLHEDREPRHAGLAVIFCAVHSIPASVRDEEAQTSEAVLGHPKNAALCLVRYGINQDMAVQHK